MPNTTSKLRNKLHFLLGSTLIILVAALGYDNYKAHEEIATLKAANKTWIHYASTYMINFARCSRYVREYCEAK